MRSEGRGGEGDEEWERGRGVRERKGGGRKEGE